MDYIKGLNEQQKEAVLTKAKHVRIIAGAGSGKTRVLTTRLVHLIQEMKYDPSKLCAITFTNKAANEMKERLWDMLGGYSGVHVSTIHSLCLTIIRQEYKAMELDRNFIIYDASEQAMVVKLAFEELDLTRDDLKPGDAINYISGCKTNHVSVEEAKKLSFGPEEEAKVRVYEFYVNKLIEENALDFDDLLLKVYYLLKENKAARERWQKRFDVLCVDEFQDVDEVQYGIVQSLVGKDNEIYVVGDPDQTIYSWRGANVGFISKFNKIYPDSVTITLMKNYRSTQNILDLANQLINYNKMREHKDLLAHDESDIPIVYKECNDADSEVYEIVNGIQHFKSCGGSYDDSAILYRSNYQSRMFEKALRKEKIPYIIYGGLSFYDQMEIKDLLAYLRMITNADEVALRRTVTQPRRGIGPKTLNDYLLKAQENNLTIYEMMRLDVENKEAKPNIRKYVNQIEGFKKDSETMELGELLEHIFVESGLRAEYIKEEVKDLYKVAGRNKKELDIEIKNYLATRSEEEVNSIERILSIRELVQDAKEFEAEEEDADLVDYLQTLSLFTNKQEVEDEAVVRIMTVHSAKGLEFENVFITGVSDKVFPSMRSVGESGSQGLEEERRLMYVAITRAKKNLFISNHTDFNYVYGGSLSRSRFISEMGIDVNGSIPSGQRKEVPHEMVEASKRIHQARKNKRELRSQDIVVHEVFGEGILINLKDNKATIAFNYPHGTKTLSLEYAVIKRKESDE